MAWQDYNPFRKRVSAVEPEPAPAPDPNALKNEIVDAVKREVAQTMAGELLRLNAATPVPMLANPNAPSPYGAYGFDTPIVYSTPQSPKRRPKSVVTVDTLRQLADTYDIARDCINELKRQASNVPIDIVAKEGRTVSKLRLKQAKALLTHAGGVGGIGTPYRHFEGKLLEDVLVIGAGCVFHQRAASGAWLSCVAVDAATIRPVTDAYGWAPLDGDRVYEQWVYGVQVATFGRQDMTYDGIHARTHSPYFQSPLEWLVLVVNAALKADQWNLSWLTDGTTPGDMLALPQEWTAEQIIKFQQWFDGMLSGDVSQRNRVQFVPGGSQKVGSYARKDQDFEEYELWLMRRTCAMFGVQPASIGFAGEQYKVSQESAFRQTGENGVQSLLVYRKSVLDDILDRAGYDDCEIVNVRTDTETAKGRAEVAEIKIRSGQWTINEARQADGKPDVEGGDEALILSTLTPLSRVFEIPDPVIPPDPDPTSRIERKSQKKSLNSALTDYRAAMLSREDEAVSATRAAWESAEQKIRTAWDAVTERIQEALDGGQTPDSGWLMAQERYQSLIVQINGELATLGTEVAPSIAEAQASGITDAQKAAQSLTKAAAGKAPPGVSLNWNAVDVDAVNALIGFASDGSPLSELFGDIAPDLVQAATTALTDGLAAGINPRETGSVLDSLLNVGRARAETIARTETLRAMREATRQSYKANPETVTGWTWVAACDARTCPACWAMQGTEHSVSESLESHPNCRCVMTPRTPSWAELTGDDSLPDTRPTIESGETLFGKLSESAQREILGEERFAAYAEGNLDFSALAKRTTDERWGGGMRIATLQELGL